MTFLASALILSGCSKEAQDGNGRLRIIFTASADVDNAVVSRGEPLDGLTAPGAEEFTLSLSGEGGDIAGPWNDDITKYPGEGYYLEAGSYTATALYGDIEQEGFGHPCFGVTESFSIVPGPIKQVEMTARLLNMAVTVGYSDQFKGYFTDYNTVIMRGETELADFSENSTGMAFIKPAAYKVVVSYTYQYNGVEERTGSSTFNVTENIAACTHHKVFINVNQGKTGSVTITATFNNDVETETVDVIEVGDEE